MSLEKYVEHHIKLHTLRIELIDSKALLYDITVTVKESLERWLNNRVDDSIEFYNVFLSFHTISDRIVFLRISSIKRLIFAGASLLRL